MNKTATMDEVWILLSLSAAMLVGCYAAGSLPLIFSLSESKLHYISVIGAGLLVGTALSVIIPEGVQSMCTQKDDGNSMSSHAVIGVTLVLGFVFMLLVDQLTHHFKGDVESDSSSRPKNITATVGLVVHAAADGVALGAAASTSRADVEMIIFFAIMLHKFPLAHVVLPTSIQHRHDLVVLCNYAGNLSQPDLFEAPASFGLVTFLLHEGIDIKTIRKHLLIFSIAAPITAIMTYFGISRESDSAFSSLNGSGVALLFSAGTFLYVATVHVLPEVTKSNSSRGFQRKELLSLVCGTLLPLLLVTTHHHH